ncbi:MAG: efflux RND transporter periplasmic adaptor subunit [Verrucomicrobiales bacterium]|nr:efflux RND transporter periplasmic adaptor subunit [Verrucomicrobiales bacterium]
MKSHSLITLIVALALAGFTLTGCGKKHDESDGHTHGKEQAEGKDDGHGHEEEAPSGASFKPGKGVILTDETGQSMGVETAEVAERRLPFVIQFNAQVFGENHKPTADEAEHTQCTAKASGLLSQTQALSLKAGQGVMLKPKSGEELGGIVLRVNKALAIGDAEVVVGVTNAGAKLKPGEFVFTSIAIPRGDPVAVVPKSAVLRAADGTFVYTVNGDAYFRTAVKTGVEAEGFVEITDGLLSGDFVVTKPVEKLWLIELRATKGGGHSH